MGSLRSLLKLKSIYKKYKFLFFFGLIGTFLTSVVATPIPYLIGQVLDKVLIEKNSFRKFYFYIGVIAVLYILIYFISITSKYISNKINNLMVNELKYQVLDKVMDLPMDYLSNIEKGYIQARISECSSVGAIFSSVIVTTLIGIIDAILAVSTMFVISYKLAIIVIILIPISIFLAKASSKRFTENTLKMMESGAILNGECFEIINGIEDIKILNSKKVHLLKFKEKLDDLLKLSLKQSKYMLLFVENIAATNNFGTLLILFIAGILILKGQFTVGLYISFSLYVGKVFSCTQSIAAMEATFKQACLSIDRLYELLDMDDENKGKNQIIEGKIESIKLEDIIFKYRNNSKNILDSINIEIHNGEKILIKGENGSGKSTIIKLLLGLYEPIKGRILYNNIDLTKISNISLRQRIGIVSQNIFLFKGTVLDNILYGQSEKNREDVKKLIVDLNLEHYIYRLPAGLDSEIQNTSGISGGQAQVIAFIRAMLSNKEIIILDEPISNVDTETRTIILNSLNKNNFKGILIIVSHITDGMDFIDRIIEIV